MGPEAPSPRHMRIRMCIGDVNPHAKKNINKIQELVKNDKHTAHKQATQREEEDT